MTALVLEKNPGGTLTSCDLKLTALFLHKAALLGVGPDANMAAPRSGLDNTPTVSWSTWETSTINPVVVDLIRIRALHSQIFFLYPSVFYSQAKRISWRMTYLSFLKYLTHRFLHTCLPPTRSRKSCGKSYPC